MPGPTTASVIIPSYNPNRVLIQTMDALLDMEMQERLVEIILVDSSDQADSQMLVNQLKQKSNKISVVISGTRVMPAIQRNIGAGNARGDVLLFIDADAFPGREWMKRILEQYDKGHRAGGGSYVLPDWQKRNTVAIAQYYLEFGEFIPTGKVRNKRIVPSCNIFCNRELFLKIGGFPEIRASEDSLFCLEAGKHEKLVYIPKAIVYHVFRETRIHYLNNQKLIGRFIYVYRLHFYASFYLKGVWFWMFLPVVFAVKFLRIITRAAVGGFQHWTLFLRSFFDFMLGLWAWTAGFASGREFYSEMEQDLNRVLNSIKPSAE